MSKLRIVLILIGLITDLGHISQNEDSLEDRPLEQMGNVQEDGGLAQEMG